MEPQTMKQVKEVLKNKKWSKGADLGCGYGEVSPLLKKHISYLIGVDKEATRALKSGYNQFYDELIESDIRSYAIPHDCKVITLFDVIEHLPFNEGCKLIERIGRRFIIITTPSKFFPGALDGHQSLWSEEALKQLGFQTKIYSSGLIRDRVYGKKIIAVRQ